MQQLDFLKQFAAERRPRLPRYSRQWGVRCFHLLSRHALPVRLTRWWADEGPLDLWVGVNPRIGDTERRRRPTLERCVAWSRSWGSAGLIFANLFAAPDQRNGRTP